jgi:hypothetical protein
MELCETPEDSEYHLSLSRRRYRSAITSNDGWSGLTNRAEFNQFSIGAWVGRVNTRRFLLVGRVLRRVQAAEKSYQGRFDQRMTECPDKLMCEIYHMKDTMTLDKTNQTDLIIYPSSAEEL